MLNAFFLQDIDEFFSKKREWCNTYSKAIKDISNVSFLKKKLFTFSKQALINFLIFCNHSKPHDQQRYD